MSSAANFYKHFGPRQPDLDTLTVLILKEFFEKVDFENKSADDNLKTKKHAKLPRGQAVIGIFFIQYLFYLVL